MKALIVSLESFQKGEIPEEVKQYILSQKGNIFTVLDESSKIKTNNPCKEAKKSKRTQAILRLNRIGERCILTGTFMSKSPVNAYDQMNFLCPDFFPESMYAFAEHYEIRRSLKNVRGARTLLSQKDYEAIYKRLNKARTGDYSLRGLMDGVMAFYGITEEACKWIYEHPEYTPFKNIEELWDRIGNTCMRAERKFLKDLPPKLYKTYKIPLTKEQLNLYLQLQNTNCTDNIAVDNGLKLYLRFQDICNGYEPLDGGEVIGKDGKLHHLVKLHPLKENPKLDILEEIVEDIGDKHIVIWCSRSVLLYDAEARLKEKGYTTAIYDGKIDKKEREAGYQSFSEGKTQIIFVNQASGAYGLNGLKEADYAIYLCNSYSVEHRAQSEDRIYRGEITRSKYIIDISCEGPCEERVTEALKVGKELIDSGETDPEIFKYTGGEV